MTRIRDCFWEVSCEVGMWEATSKDYPIKLTSKTWYADNKSAEKNWKRYVKSKGIKKWKFV